jgi:general secretion pathway protein D
MNLRSWLLTALATLALLPLSSTAQFGGGFGGGGGGGLSSRRSTTTYPSSTQIGDAMISSDTETRKLIVVTDDETAKAIGQVITNLDRSVPQVLIKVVFLEVTYRKGFDIGLEGAYQKNLGGGSTGSLSQVFGLASQGASPTPPGAGMYQILGSDFQVTLRAIAEAGKTEVLSRPSVLARNNQEATITVGQQVPLITNVRYDNFGNQINSINYQSVGIILRVTPFITDQGLVEMIVAPEISNLSDQTVAVAAGVAAPVINTRSADTVVVTPDGQTVVIGGLMQNTKTSSDNKIPFLGDIPGLGSLFKRRSSNGSKTELLIFLTPHIVRQPTQLAGLANQARGQLQLVPQSFSEQELNRYLQDVPVKEPSDEPAAPAAPSTSAPAKKSRRSNR